VWSCGGVELWKCGGNGQARTPDLNHAQAIVHRYGTVGRAGGGWTQTVHLSACGAAAPLPSVPPWGEEPASLTQRGSAGEGIVTLICKVLRLDPPPNEGGRGNQVSLAPPRAGARGRGPPGKTPLRRVGARRSNPRAYAIIRRVCVGPARRAGQGKGVSPSSTPAPGREGPAERRPPGNILAHPGNARAKPPERKDTLVCSVVSLSFSSLV
jgi:hypothetical protein